MVEPLVAPGSYRDPAFSEFVGILDRIHSLTRSIDESPLEDEADAE
jgi:hypothetical protein